MYEVGLSRTMRACHVMPGRPGSEGRLHCYDYRIDVVVDRERLDESGMVCDLDVRRRSRHPGVGNAGRVRRIPRAMLTICLPTWEHSGQDFFAILGAVP
jgi:6-pyruvoyl tetrahydropterin synthase